MTTETRTTPQTEPRETRGQHIPGPWTVYVPKSGNATYGIDAEGVGASVCIFGESPYGGGIPRIQDARLIAAAPDLLQALQLLHDNLAEYQRINNLGGYDNHDMRMARAAIAKAIGESA